MVEVTMNRQAERVGAMEPAWWWHVADGDRSMEVLCGAAYELPPGHLQPRDCEAKLRAMAESGELWELDPPHVPITLHDLP